MYEIPFSFQMTFDPTLCQDSFFDSYLYAYENYYNYQNRDSYGSYSYYDIFFPDDTSVTYKF